MPMLSFSGSGNRLCNLLHRVKLCGGNWSGLCDDCRNIYNGVYIGLLLSVLRYHLAAVCVRCANEMVGDVMSGSFHCLYNAPVCLRDAMSCQVCCRSPWGCCVTDRPRQLAVCMLSCVSCLVLGSWHQIIRWISTFLFVWSARSCSGQVILSLVVLLWILQRPYSIVILSYVCVLWLNCEMGLYLLSNSIRNNP